MKLLNEILGIKYPIIQGGMANIANAEFAAACSNAGGLGIIATGGIRTAEDLEAEIDKCRSLTDKPFGVNIMMLHPRTEQYAHIVAEKRVPVITTGAGSPGQYMEMWKEAGCLVFPVSAAPLMAKHFEKQGADGIIAEGTESGGHVGEMTTMALVPQTVDEVDIPVIAAGGIADGRQMASAFLLGAIGVQVGTCLLASEECPIHENYKNAVLKAKGSDTVVMGRSINTPVRSIKNKMIREYMQLEKEGADREKLETYTLGALRKAVHEGDIEMGSLMSGQVCGMLKTIRPVAEIFEEMWSEAKSRIRSTGDLITK